MRNITVELGTIPGDLLNELARRFERHAKNIYGAASSSPLYEQLCLNIAADPAVLALVTQADLSTQVSNLLLGAVHFLLLSGSASPLAEFYPGLCPTPRPREEAYPYFRAFCLEHADTVRRLVTTQRVQTNEVRRCTALLPAFGLIAQRSGNRPLALVEIGPSAGLHLLWDKYGYDYGEGGYRGNRESPVQLACQLQGNIRPPLPVTLPTVGYRVGIDLLPIDVRDEKAVRWLRALIWPEHADRAALLEQAIEMARLDPPPLIAGNAVDLLPQVLANVSVDTVLCVYHSYMLNQCSKLIREKIAECLLAFSQERAFFEVSLEWYSGQRQPALELLSYHDGNVESELLAYCESHGRMLEWVHS